MKRNILLFTSFLLFINVFANITLTDPGFENGGTNWNYQTNSASAASINYRSSTAHNGSYGCALSVTSESSENWHIQLNVPNQWTAVSGNTYTLSFYVKSDVTTSIHIAAQDGAPSYEYRTGVDAALQAGADWKEVNFQYISDQSGTGAVNFNIFVGGATGTYYFDDFTITEYDPNNTTPFTAPPTTGAYYTDVYRNIFTEIGKDPAAVTNKLNSAFDQLFYGDNTTERVYYPVGTDMAYILDYNNGDIRTEGQSYGMMICVQMDKQEEFDRLWKYAKTYLQHSSGDRQGYFGWSADPNTNTLNDDNSAPDGEEYFAMALFFASHRWGDGTGIFDYKAEANQLLHDMLHLEERNGGINNGLTNMFNLTEKMVVFTPQWDNADFSDPSYHLPAFYKLWALWAEKDNQFWEDAAAVSDEYLQDAMHPTTGFTTDYMTFDAQPKSTSFNDRSDDFSGDSWRVAMNVAMDCHWWGKQDWQVTKINTLLNYLSDQGPAYLANYTWDGTPLSTNNYHSSGFVAMNGVAPLSATTSNSLAFIEELWGMSIPTGQYRYYDGLLYMLAMLNSSGQYKIWKPSTENVAPVVSFAIPSADTTVTEGYNLNIKALVDDDNLAYAVLYIDGDSIRTVTAAPYEWGHSSSPVPDELNGLSAGEHTITVFGVDEEGARSSASFTLTVEEDSPVQITGIIYNEQNQPLENALVSHKNDPYTFIKTNANGEFSISGNVGIDLQIAALHYQTTIYTVSQASGNSFILPTDTLLNTDVYHISFDHLRPGAAYSKEELKDDFPVGYGKGFLESNDPATDRAYVDPTMDFNGDGRSLRVTYPAGQVKTASSGVDTRIPLEGVFNNNTFAADELYLSYWIRFSDNFDMDACGGKLPSLGGSNAYERENEWKGRIMWGVGGSIRFYMELPHDADGIDADSIRFLGEKIYDGGDICTNRFTPYLDNTQWHQIEMHYKMEVDGKPGLFEVWIDGDKGHKILDSEEFGLYRRPGEGMDNLTINAILISSFLGGGDGWEQDETVHAWFDEFRVSTQRIGNGSNIPPIPSQTIALQHGWNLVSLYVEPNVCRDAIHCVSTVFPNATVIKTESLFYNSSQPDFLNSLQTIEAGVGYLVYNTIDETITINGSNTSSVLLELKDGWNLAGVPSSTSVPLSEIPDATLIKDFNGFYEPNNGMSTISELRPGKAYFIKK